MGTAAPVRILVVDDDVRNGVAIRATLEGLDAEVVVVTSGADALRALLADHFAVVLLDVQMPGMDGFETAELIRRRDRTRDVPIVFVTAIHLADEHVRRGYELGAVDYLFKPFEPAILRQKVRVFVELARARLDAEEHARLLASSEARYRELVDGLPSVVYRRSPGPDGEFVFISASLEALLGITPLDWLAKPCAWREALHPDDRERVVTAWAQPVADDRALRLDYRLVARDGRVCWIEDRAHVVRAPGSASPEGVVAVQGVWIDVTERHALSEADVALRRARVDADIWNRELEAFSSAVAHDLRSPLRAIHGYVGILLEDHGPQLDEVARPLLARIVAAVDRMSRLIDDLLVLSHCSQVTMVRRTVDLSALARDILRRFAQDAPERDVHGVVADGLRVEGDPQLLELLMENLLANAWKFTSHHARATIEVGRDARTGELFVRDDGAGFDPAFARSLFLPFHRLHGTEFEGDGVGLATVDRIVRRHGGTVRAEGRVEGGATFFFTLP